MDKCKMCNNNFPRKYRSKGIRKIYCSKKCRYEDSWVTKICITCKNSFQKNLISRHSDLYCSLACIQRNPCEICGIIITGRKTIHKHQKKFCSRRCSAFFHKTINSKVSYVPKGFSQTIKRKGIICCERCGHNEIDVLCVHHINGDRKDNSQENLETVCANCHQKQHWQNSRVRKKHIELAYRLSKISL